MSRNYVVIHSDIKTQENQMENACKFLDALRHLKKVANVFSDTILTDEWVNEQNVLETRLCEIIEGCQKELRKLKEELSNDADN